MISVSQNSQARINWKITKRNHVISASRNSQARKNWKITMREPCNQCITEFTSKDRLKDHNERTMRSVYHGIHKQRQIERSQRKDLVISIWRISQAHTHWNITKREPCDQCMTEFTSKHRLEDHKERTIDQCMTEVTSKYRFKDHKERTMWSVCDGIHKQIQIERSQ